jgi:cytochrome P450
MTSLVHPSPAGDSVPPFGRLRWPHRRSGSRSPALEIDLFNVESLRNPAPTYRAIRDAGRVVWLPRHRVWAMGRYADVRAALRNDELYRNSDAVSFNRIQRPVVRKAAIGSDGPTHSRRRKVLMQSLGAKALGQLQPELDATAHEVVEDLVTRATFDGVGDFASQLPLRVIADMVGVRIDHDHLLAWGRRAFDGNGPLTNRRVLRVTPTALRIWLYTARLSQSRVVPGSWASAVLAAGERGDLTKSEARNMVVDFILPSLDTTILAAAQLLWSLGRNPDAWQLLRRSPDLVPSAVVEAVRLASPVRAFTRRLARDEDIDGVRLREGERVALLYGSANLDERQFPNPEFFDLDRRGGNVGWGYGAHACVGMHLSKLEMEALLRAMIPRVERIQVDQPRRLINNGLQGFSSFRALFN